MANADEVIVESVGKTESFNVNNFRSSLAHGVANPSLFSFTLSKDAKINEFTISKEDKNFLSNLNNIQETVNKGLGIAKNFIPQAYGISAYYNQAMSTANNLFGKSPQQTFKDLTFRVSRTSIPDRIIETYPTKYYGIQYNNPRDISTNYLTLNIMSSETYWEHWYFSRWMGRIIDYSNEDGDTYDVAYYDDIVTNGLIEFYNSEGNRTYTANIYDLYPVHVQGIDGDWSRKDSINNFNVTFAYKNVSVNQVSETKKNSLEKIIKTGIGVANQFGARIPSGVGKTIGTISKEINTNKKD